MNCKLGSWEEIKQCNSVLIFAEDGIDEKLQNSILNVTEMSALPNFPDQVGKNYSIFTKNGEKKCCIFKVNGDGRSHKNTEMVRSIIQKLELDATTGICTSGLSEKTISDIVLGVYLSFYNFESQKKEQKTNDRSFVLLDDHVTPTLLQKMDATANAMMFSMSLVDMPANVKTPDHAVDLVVEECKRRKLEIKVLDKFGLISKGFGAILAVGRASEYGSYLLEIHYKGRNSSSEIDLTLVGKGVTFDTGGISLKNPTNMHFMKSDLGGAAAALGAIFLASDLGLSANVCVLVPFVENSVDSSSLRPSDVITAFGGNTIEVIDTDAEGRLILADALSYACNELDTKSIIDLATLTGSIVSALGYSAAGLFSTNKKLIEQLTSCGEEVGERCWPMPMYEDYEEMMQSDIADIKNFSARPIAGAITAAKFLEFFTAKHEAWAHLDIAGVAFGDSSIVKSKIATAYGVRLLTKFIETQIVE